jgi:hypothetical protein
MDGIEFKRAIERLGYNQSSFARTFGMPLRTVQHWAKHGAPAHLGRILDATLLADIALPTPADLKSPSTARMAASEAARPAVASMLERGERAGWPRAALIAGIVQILLDEIADFRND